MVNVLYSYSTALGKKVATLEDMVVLKKYRQKRYGTKLLKSVLKKLDKEGVARVTLLTDFDNFKAHKFYKRQGFKKSSMIVLRR
jgi:AraC family transcriptional regulator of adaptative response/methylated-DNA-[protein]-cysteine methyltransferase